MLEQGILVLSSELLKIIITVANCKHTANASNTKVAFIMFDIFPPLLLYYLFT